MLKHYHLWEPDEDIQQLCADVVQILITPEMEDEVPGEKGDLRDVDVQPAANGGGDVAQEPRTFQVGAPEGMSYKWRPDHRKADISES